MSGGFAFAWGAASHPGQVRSNNQDSALAEEGLFAVADGMGGHAAGEVASQVAVDALRGSAGDGLVEAVRIANRAVWERAAEDPSLRGMGTTLCAIALVEDGSEPRVTVANVGDSRVYLHRDGDLMQLTDDHSLVAELEREGRLTAEEARVHPQRNIVTRVLGNEPDVEVDVWTIDPLRGDRFLLCSDGLFNEVDEDDIAGLLRRLPDPQEAADQLVDAANRGGGRDNITVVVVDVVDDDGRAQRASAAVGAAGTSASAGETTALRAPSAPPPASSSDAASSARSGRGDRDRARDGEPRARRLTWRSALFLLAVLVVLAAAVGSVTWYARNTYYVGTDGEVVTIYRGRPGGLLWIDPTVEERTDLTLDDVPPARRSDVETGKEQPTLEDARRYVANLERQAEEREQTTTTTTATTAPPATPTTAPPPPTSSP